MKRIICLVLALVLALAMLPMATVTATSATGPVTGAIWTTDSTGTAVNMNHYDLKTDVYLNGGPHSSGSSGLPNGPYYVKVTAPNGDLLGESNGTVTVTNGIFPLLRLWDLVTYPDGITLGYDDTTNHGGVYKVWVSQDPNFGPGSNKTDNFKVRESTPPPPPPGAPPLEVTKTATPSFTRTYNWTITKAVDKTLVEQIGGTATFNYTVVVTQTGFTDSNWQVTGQITLTNNTGSDITGIDVTDAADNGGNGVVTGGTNVTVPANSSVDLDYTVTYSSVPTPGAGINTATAAWSLGPTSGTAPFDFADANVNPIDQTVTVNDAFGIRTVPPTTPTVTTLGTLTATDTAPYASATYTYSHTVHVPTWGNAFYDNTATIVETGQTARQSVEVSGPAKTGALTMGYWQNKNGQGLITASNFTSLSSFLKGYKPFQDLTATTSSGIATYVNNIIKAANASGTSMNAMLKAQMLSTALDVYFNPSLGGVSIDLTKIYTGTGSTYKNVSVAFGGATSMTVSGMLNYAAGQSNATGSIWYAQNKATQELAKDAFDAINNQWAFSP